MALHAVQVARAALKVAVQGVVLAEAAWKPEWAAEFTYQQREAGNGEAGAEFDGDDWVSGRLTFTVPLWSSSKQDPLLRAAQAEEAAAEAVLLEAARSAYARYTALEGEREAAQSSRNALEDKLAAISEQLESRLSLYESGAGDYASLVDAEIALLRLRADMRGEQARMAIATARMNALLVTP
jgi:outer membrane protein TolC